MKLCFPSQKMGGESNANVSPELNLQFSISFIETEKTMTNAYGMFHLLYEQFFILLWLQITA